MSYNCPFSFEIVIIVKHFMNLFWL